LSSPPQPAEQVDHLAAGQVRPQRHVAGHVRQPTVQRDRVVPGIAAEQPGRAGVGAHQAEQDTDGGGLPGTVGAEEAMHFTGPHGQVESVQGAHLPERLDQSVGPDRLGHRCAPSDGSAALPR
jgi:hypothetical protein